LSDRVEITTKERGADGLLQFEVARLGISSFELDLPIRPFVARFGTPSELILDFLCVAGFAYVIDKAVPRARCKNGWTRNLDVTFPVSNPQAWSAIADDLTSALRFLTGDEWSIDFTGANSKIYLPPKKRRRSRRLADSLEFDSVNLFSGGLDSLAGAIDSLAAGRRVMLVGHHDAPGPESQQLGLYGALARREEYRGRVELFHSRISHRPRAANEGTLRSRSLVFMAMGMCACEAIGGGVLRAYENGFIALNTPLTPSRASSCSTRTMHPFFLSALRRVIAGLGIHTEIVNPYELKTKGECLLACPNQVLIRELARASVSCSHGSRRQNWFRKNVANCGYCIPCLIRRAALQRLGADLGSDYGIDVAREELKPDSPLESANDLRALISGTKSLQSKSAIRRAIISVSGQSITDEHIEMAWRGFEELRDWMSARSLGA
jgi:hypothetical protein